MPTDRIDAALLAVCPQLRSVCNCAVGYNNFDLEACTRAGCLGVDSRQCDPRLFKFDNVVLTPRMKLTMLAADNLIAALSGSRPLNLLNPSVENSWPIDN